MARRILTSLCLSALLTVTLPLQPALAQEVPLKGLGRFDGWRDNALIGYGIVTGLAGSGDTRRNEVTGSFSVNDDGFIVLSGTEYRLGVLDAAGRPISLNIDDIRTSAPEETTKIEFKDNLSRTATEHTIPDVRIFDARGGEHKWTLEFTREEPAGPVSMAIYAWPSLTGKPIFWRSLPAG